MAFLYVACLLPAALGLIVYLKSHQINWMEYAIATAAAFLTAGITHIVAFKSQTGDFEIWSGQINQTRQFSAWQEYYEEAIYRTRTVGSGKNARTVTEFSHWAPRTRWHGEYWKAYSTIDTDHLIGKSDFERLCKAFDSKYAVRGDRRTGEHASRMISGDPNDYVGDKMTDVIIPIHVSRPFTNRLKAAPNVFTNVAVPKGTPVFDYPEVGSIWQSGRLLGTAKTDVSIEEWDKFNAVMGPAYQVNLIMIGFDSPDTMMAEWQKSHWFGGKKNDLVLCYGDGWSRVFGWSSSEECKRNLEDLLLKRPITNDIIPQIREILVSGNYKRKDWHEFDYVTVEPSTTQWMVFLFVMLGVQVGLYYAFHFNQYDKDY